MSIAFHNKGKSVIKIGDVVILPDKSYNFEGDAFKEICSNPMDIESTSQLRHNKIKELTKEEKTALRSNFTYDPWHKKPCCIVPPCAHCVVCIDCCIRPPIPGAGLICKVPQLLCGFFTNPCCVYHCKCCEFPTCGCSGLKCISCPSCACPSCPCGLPMCTICPPTCLWCGIKCPPSCPKCCHSSRVGFACALLAAGCPPATIQALARWSSAESLAVYARLNPADYAGWVSKALLQRTDSVTTRRLPPLPLIDDFDIVASFATAERTFERIEKRQRA